MNDALWLALYQLARHLLTTLPSLDTIEGVERQGAIEIKSALVSFVRVTERKFNLPSTIPSRKDRKEEFLCRAKAK